VRIGAEYLRIAAITLCSYVILFQTVFMLQGLKKPVYGLWVGLYRQIVAPCVVFWLLAFQLGWELRGIWWGIFGVTWSAALFMAWFGRWKLRQVEAAAQATGKPGGRSA
jgi:Na+-driven multidrug efflux pump